MADAKKKKTLIFTDVCVYTQLCDLRRLVGSVHTIARAYERRKSSPLTCTNAYGIHIVCISV